MNTIQQLLNSRANIERNCTFLYDYLLHFRSLVMHPILILENIVFCFLPLNENLLNSAENFICQIQHIFTEKQEKLSHFTSCFKFTKRQNLLKTSHANETQTGWVF